MSDIRITPFRGKWHAVWYDTDGIRRRVSLGVPAKEAYLGDAQRAAHDIERQLKVPIGDTVAHIWSAYMADHGNDTRDSKRLENAWKPLKPFFGHLRPDQIDRQLCKKYAENRKRAPGTIIKELSSLRSALNWHDKHHEAVFWLPPTPKPKDAYLTREQFRRLLKASQGVYHLTVFLELAIGTAARKEALFSLRWENVNLERRRIDLGLVDRGKSRAVITINNRLLPVLQTAKSVAVSPYVVEYAGGRISSIRTSLRAASEKAGLPWVTPHVLRHTAAVWMAEAGVPMSEIAQYLGHADDRITQRVYARYSPEYLRKAASALEV